jgi:hypothetical protein
MRLRQHLRARFASRSNVWRSRNARFSQVSTLRNGRSASWIIRTSSLQLMSATLVEAKWAIVSRQNSSTATDALRSLNCVARFTEDVALANSVGFIRSPPEDDRMFRARALRIARGQARWRRQEKEMCGPHHNESSHATRCVVECRPLAPIDPGFIKSSQRQSG